MFGETQEKSNKRYTKKYDRQTRILFILAWVVCISIMIVLNIYHKRHPSYGLKWHDKRLEVHRHFEKLIDNSRFERGEITLILHEEGTEVNAYAGHDLNRGKIVVITKGMLDLYKHDYTYLVPILAHEIAHHYYITHYGRYNVDSINEELGADMLGIRLMEDAGYSRCLFYGNWLLNYIHNLPFVFSSGSHPSIHSRLLYFYTVCVHGLRS